MTHHRSFSLIQNLTPIEGAPNNKSSKILKKQLFANACAVHSTRGGGMHGHMSLLLAKNSYRELTGSNYNLPNHPGDAPTHTAGLPKAQIAEINQQYNATLLEFKTYHDIHATLKQQILTAVSHIFLNTLEDDLMGYSNVDAVDMLDHLAAKYATITSDDIKRNQATLSAPWNPDTEIKDLWLQINQAQLFSLDADNNNTHEISNETVIHLALVMFEKEQLFITYCDMWRNRDKSDCTLTMFQNHFEKANKGQLCKLTANQVGYYGATNAAQGAQPPIVEVISNECVQVNDGCQIYYCWTHGLGKNHSHTSATCTHPAEGHIIDATAKNMKDGNNCIMTGRCMQIGN